MGYARKVKAFVDGGCNGNPKPGAVGVVLFDGNGNELEKDSRAVNRTMTSRVDSRPYASDSWLLPATRQVKW